jgi:type II secretory pathway pseudopilin PulG
MRSPHRHHPFTLIELLASIAIITLLAGLIIGGVSAGMRKASESRTRSRMQQIVLALEQYRQDWGYYPVSSGIPLDVRLSPQNGIIDFRFDHTFLQSPSGKLYIPGYPTDTDGADNNDFRDGFEQYFLYRCPGIMNPESYDLWSMGADGRHGPGAATTPTSAQVRTDCDDITNWKR